MTWILVAIQHSPHLQMKVKVSSWTHALGFEAISSSPSSQPSWQQKFSNLGIDQSNISNHHILESDKFFIVKEIQIHVYPKDSEALQSGEQIEKTQPIGESQPILRCRVWNYSRRRSNGAIIVQIQLEDPRHNPIRFSFHHSGHTSLSWS